MDKSYYDSLAAAFQRKNYILVSNFIKHFHQEGFIVDMFYKEGLYFQMAICKKDIKALNILLDYMYEMKEIEKDPQDNNTEQSIKYRKLQKILIYCRKEHRITINDGTEEAKALKKTIDDLVLSKDEENSEYYQSDESDNCSDIFDLELTDRESEEVAFSGEVEAKISDA